MLHGPPDPAEPDQEASRRTCWGITDSVGVHGLSPYGPFDHEPDGAIREAVRSLFNVSMSTNTIQRNEEAYAVYLQHRTYTPRVRAKSTALKAVLAGAHGDRSAALRARINRLRRESKDTLIARVMELEKSVERHAQHEDNLREEILRLTLGSGQKGSDK